MRGRRDLRAVMLAAVGCALVAVVVPLEPLRVIAAIPLLLVLPGFAVMQASFPRRPPAWPLLATLTIGLSLSLLAVGVVILHLLPGRFGEASWAAWALLITLGGCAVAAWRRPARAGSTPRSEPRRGMPPLPRPQVAMLAVAAVALAGTVILAAEVWPAKNAIGYTRLWMLPSEPGAKVPHVTVGIQSEEQEQTVYRLVLDVGGVRSLRRADLEPGHVRIWRVSSPVPDVAAQTHVTARLFTKNDPFKVYRRVTGWIPAP